MGSRFGHDFRHVRIHTDTQASNSARDVSAAAFTVGQHVVFGPGRYAPETDRGRELLGHELAHTIQQGGPSSTPPSPEGAGIAETTASAAGRAVANGQAVGIRIPPTAIGLARAPATAYGEEAEDAQRVLRKGTLWVEQKILNALLTDRKTEHRASNLAYSRALVDAEIGITRRQEAHQQFAPTLDDRTERRIAYRRKAMNDIVRTKSVREGLNNAEENASDPDQREQIQLVRTDLKQVQDEFRSRAYDNAYKLLDSSSREVATMLQSYGLHIARAEDVVHFVRVYEGELKGEAAKWVETARIADTSGYSELRKIQHRKDLSTTLKRLRTLQYWVRRLQPPKDPLADAASVVGATLPWRPPDSPELKHAKLELAGAWLNAEREHPVLASYRAGKEDSLEDVELGPGGETEDAQDVVSHAIRVLVNILTAKLALQQKKVSPFELAPIVALTRAQMLIRRGSVWDIAIEEMMRGDDDGEEWAKEALRTALSAIILVFPLAWPLMVASAALNLHDAGTAYVRYGLDQALIGTNLDRAKALSNKEPSLAGFAWALVGTGLDLVGAKAAFEEAQLLRAKALAGDAEAVAALDKLGEAHGVPHLGEDVAKTRPAPATAEPKPIAGAPSKPKPPPTEESFGRPTGRVPGRDRKKISRPFYRDDPNPPTPKPAPPTTRRSAAPAPRNPSHGIPAPGVSTPPSRVKFYDLLGSRKSRAQWWLRDVDPAEVAASQRGRQVYEYYTADGQCLYVGKAGGTQDPGSWVDRGWDHLNGRPEISEADRIVVHADLTEQEAFALEQDRIRELRPRINISEGEFTPRSKQGAANLAANVQSASKRPTFSFKTDMVPGLRPTVGNRP